MSSLNMALISTVAHKSGAPGSVSRPHCHPEIRKGFGRAGSSANFCPKSVLTKRQTSSYGGDGEVTEGDGKVHISGSWPKLPFPTMQHGRKFIQGPVS